MMLSSVLLLTTLARSVAFSPCGTSLAPILHHPLQRLSSAALSYSNGESDGEPVLLPEMRRNVEQSSKAGSPRRVPRRAMPHVQNASHTEAAIRAGYIIPHGEAMQGGTDENDSMKNRQESQRSTERGVRPLRTIRRIVHQSRQEQPSQRLPQEEPIQIGIEAPNSSIDIHVRNRSNHEISRSRQPQRLPRSPNEEERKSARRVTFKATRESSKSIISKPVATLTEYMTQPVSQYSLLSFHDAEESNNNRNSNQSMSRRWIVRRLTTEEAQQYMDVVSSEGDTAMEESNLFRLAVPLLPLIGWDLTPVIDLEVIPPKKNHVTSETASIDNLDETSNWAPLKGIRKRMGDSSSDVKCSDDVDHPPIDIPDETTSSNWAPLRGIRKRMGDHGGDEDSSDDVGYPPVVKIRSLRVSLLSTQEEVKAVMSKDNGRSNNKMDSNMQKEALEMVGKVEEWLRPHISFKAELSWDDNSDAAEESVTSSTVSVKSTAITSLTIPKLPSDILRKTVPSGLIVKRLGATLTSRALAICLPRFLRQLEKDYMRWSVGLGADGVEKNSAAAGNISK